MAPTDDPQPDFSSLGGLRGRPGIIVPTEVSVTWPSLPGAPLARLLESGDSPNPESFFRACCELASSLAPEHAANAPSLGPWSLRWDGEELLASVLPGAAHLASRWTPPFHEPVGPIPANDLYVLGVVMFRVFTGRWPASRADALAASGVLGGEWPLGADVAVRLCLNPDPEQGAQDAAAFVQGVQRFLDADEGAPSPEGTALAVAEESITGWQKAKGRPGGDNEDAIGWTRTAAGTVGIVLDGVTGDGEGGGRWAANAIRDAATRAWSSEVSQPTEVLDVANKQLGAPPAELPDGGAAVGVALLVDHEHRLSLASLGDCPAFLCRPTGLPDATGSLESADVSAPASYRVTRLAPEDSVVAEKLRAGEPIEDADVGVVTTALGTGTEIAPHRRTLALQAGDYIVIATDGAAKSTAEAGTEHLEGWRFAIALERLLEGRPPPALLAARLCWRAEELGGTDNATVLILLVERTEEQREAAMARVVTRLRRIARAAGEIVGA